MAGIRARIIHGASLLVYLNGRLFGRCTGMTFGSMTPRKRLHTIDDPQAQELMATTTDVMWSLSALRVVGDLGMQGAGVVAPNAQVIKEKYFTLMVVERVSKRPVFQSDFNQVDSEQWQVRPKGFLVGEVSGGGLAWVNSA